MIKRISDKLRKRKVQYARDRKDFLIENPWCAWGLRQNPPEYIRSEQIHHKFGRIGRLLNYQPGWLAVSAKGHDWINRNPAAARGLGLLCQLGQYNSYDAAVRACEK